MPSILTIWGLPTGKISSAVLEKHATIHQPFTNFTRHFSTPRPCYCLINREQKNKLSTVISLFINGNLLV
jgi:hypothetical protein